MLTSKVLSTGTAGTVDACVPPYAVLETVFDKPFLCRLLLLTITLPRGLTPRSPSSWKPFLHFGRLGAWGVFLDSAMTAACGCYVGVADNKEQYIGRAGTTHISVPTVYEVADVHRTIKELPSDNRDNGRVMEWSVGGQTVGHEIGGIAVTIRHNTEGVCSQSKLLRVTACTDNKGDITAQALLAVICLPRVAANTVLWYDFTAAGLVNYTKITGEILGYYGGERHAMASLALYTIDANELPQK